MTAGRSLPGRLEWLGEEELTVGGTKLHILPDEKFFSGDFDLGDARFVLAKPRRLIDRYVELVADLLPQRIFELGVFHGGSTVLLEGLARPRRLVAIDLREGSMKRLHEFIAERGDAVMRAYGGVDQANRARLAEIYAADFGDEPLDLVIDDCSHLYAPTLASFNELFPRLRPGGLYVIEDWPWAHSPGGHEGGAEGFYPDEVPLTRLAFELLLAIPSHPGLIADVAVDLGAVTVRRGEAAVDPEGFDVTAALSPRGRALLAPLDVA